MATKRARETEKKRTMGFGVLPFAVVSSSMACRTDMLTNMVSTRAIPSLLQILHQYGVEELH